MQKLYIVLNACIFENYRIMGAGFNIQIINATPFTMKNTSLHSYQMEWNPVSEIEANTYAQFYGEFSYGGYTIDDAADASYKLVDLGNLGSLEFNIHVQVGGINNLPSPYSGVSADTGYGVIVQWKSIPEGFFVFPTPDVNNNSPVGWIHDGVVSIGIGYFPGTAQQKISNYPTPEYGGGNCVDDLTALRPSVKHWASNWIELFAPCIENLTLQELTLPGTCNSGAYLSAEIQSLSIQDQLEQGVRVLDLGLEVNGSDDDRFQIYSGLTLTNVLNQINDYLYGKKSIIPGFDSFGFGPGPQGMTFDDSNSPKSKEIIILDFSLVNGNWSEKDYQDVTNLITSKLGKSIIQRDQKSKTLSDIWKTQGRVIVSVHCFDRSMTDWLQSNTQFWIDSIELHCCDTNAKSWSGVQADMQEELNNVDKAKDNLWALMIQYYPNIYEPAYVPKEISKFFSGLNGIKSNIIYVALWDYIKSDVFQDNGTLSGIVNSIAPNNSMENRIPNFSTLINAVPLNIMKGYRKKNNLNLW